MSTTEILLFAILIAIIISSLFFDQFCFWFNNIGKRKNFLWEKIKIKIQISDDVNSDGRKNY